MSVTELISEVASIKTIITTTGSHMPSHISGISHSAADPKTDGGPGCGVNHSQIRNTDNVVATTEPTVTQSHDTQSKPLIYSDAVRIINKAIGDSEHRGRNIVVTVVPEQYSDALDEKSFLINMFKADLQYDLVSHVVSSKRLGQLPNRYNSRRLLISLDTATAAFDVLSRAHRLRDSNDTCIVSSVFINKDMYGPGGGEGGIRAS